MNAQIQWSGKNPWVRTGTNAALPNPAGYSMGGFRPGFTGTPSGTPATVTFTMPATPSFYTAFPGTKDPTPADLAMTCTQVISGTDAGATADSVVGRAITAYFTGLGVSGTALNDVKNQIAAIALRLRYECQIAQAAQDALSQVTSERDAARARDVDAENQLSALNAQHTSDAATIADLNSRISQLQTTDTATTIATLQDQLHSAESSLADVQAQLAAKGISPMMLVGGAAVVGGIIYLMMKKKA